MMYYSENVRKAVIEQIANLRKKVSAIPDNILNYNDACSVNHFLSMLEYEICKENKKANKS